MTLISAHRTLTVPQVGGGAVPLQHPHDVIGMHGASVDGADHPQDVGPVLRILSRSSPPRAATLSGP